MELCGDDAGLGGLERKLRVSGMVADSIMMGIVNSAMEQAFDRACSKEGVIGRLNDKSRFCELAVMQLEWCLKFVQQVSDDDEILLIDQPCFERQRLVSDLTHTRDRIQCHLLETESALRDKDWELLSLQQPFQTHDRLSMSRDTRGGVSCWVGGDDNGGDFCELKNSLDQQFFNIKQKLEKERINFSKNDITHDHLEELMAAAEENHHNSHETAFQLPDHSLSTGFEKMRSDIDILKKTFDVAFGMMSNAISLAEVGPLEWQWRWAVEKDTFTVVLRGFLREIQRQVQGLMEKARREGNTATPTQMPLGDDWFQLMDEIASLRHELDQLINQKDEQPKTNSTHDSVTSPPITIKNVGGSDTLSKEILCSKEDPSCMGKTDEEQGFPEDLHNDQSTEEQRSLVAQMIRNHEYIIRKKSEELNWLKGEIFREKGSSALAAKKDKGRDTMSVRIQNLISRLDCILTQNMNLDKSYADYTRGFSVEEVKQLKNEEDDLNLETMVMVDICVIVIKYLVNDFRSTYDNNDMLRAIGEDIYQVFFREVLKECKEKIASYNTESQIREKMHYIIHSEVLKDAHILQNSLVNKDEDIMEHSPYYNQFHSLECLINEGVQKIVLRGMCQKFENFLEMFNIENIIREEVVEIVLRNVGNNISCTHGFIPTEYQKAKIEGKLPAQSSFNNTEIEKLECIVIQNDVCMAFLREMLKEWEKERESYNIDHIIRNKKKSQKLLLPNNVLLHRLHLGKRDKLMQTLESVLNCFKLEEGLLLSASMELIERKASIDHLELEREKPYDDVSQEGTSITKYEGLGSVVEKLEMATQHIIMNKVWLKELRSYLSLGNAELNGECDDRTSVPVNVEDSKSSHCQNSTEEDVHENLLTSLQSIFTSFSKAIKDFECMVHGKIGHNVSRLEELKQQLQFSVEHVTSIRKKEFLYRDAFHLRCRNLQKAEAEVDLLADELDDLLNFLEKIYIALNHYSPILQHYFGIDDILKLIRKELKRPVAGTIL